MATEPHRRLTLAAALVTFVTFVIAVALQLQLLNLDEHVEDDQRLLDRVERNSKANTAAIDEFQEAIDEFREAVSRNRQLNEQHIAQLDRVERHLCGGECP